MRFDLLFELSIPPQLGLSEAEVNAEMRAQVEVGDPAVNAPAPASALHQASRATTRPAAVP